LARIQIDLRDQIRGAAANVNGYANKIDSAYVDMCSSYKFRTVGWTNVNVWALRLLILLVLCVYGLSFETTWFSEEKELIAESMWDASVLRMVRYLFRVHEEVRREETNGANDVNGVAEENGGPSTDEDGVGENSAPRHVIGEDSD